jgi:hypothetical protein
MMQITAVEQRENLEDIDEAVQNVAGPHNIHFVGLLSAAYIIIDLQPSKNQVMHITCEQFISLLYKNWRGNRKLQIVA